jgi:hypothetical protein
VEENLGRRSGWSLIGDEGRVGLKEGPAPSTSSTEQRVVGGGSGAMGYW